MEYESGPVTIVRKGTQRVTRARRDALTARKATAARAAETLDVGEPTRPTAPVMYGDDGMALRATRTVVTAWQGEKGTRTTFHAPRVVDDTSSADGLYLAAERAVSRYVRRWGMPRIPDVAEEAAQSAVIATLYGSGDPEADARAAELPGDRARVSWFAARAYRANMPNRPRATFGGRKVQTLSLDQLAESGDSIASTLAADAMLAESALDGADACKADIACGVHTYRNGGPGHTEGCADCADLWNGALASVAVRTTVRGGTRKATQGRKADDSIAARILAMEANGTLPGAMRAAALGMSHGAYRNHVWRLRKRADASAIA